MIARLVIEGLSNGFSDNDPSVEAAEAEKRSAVSSCYVPFLVTNSALGRSVRSVGEISDNIGIVQECNPTGAIVTGVRAEGSKAVLSRIGQIFILDAFKCVPISGASHFKGRDEHPSSPPLPVPTKRPVHCSGSHNSNVMLDRGEVGMDKATRHRSAPTT